MIATSKKLWFKKISRKYSYFKKFELAQKLDSRSDEGSKYAPKIFSSSLAESKFLPV